MAIQVKRVYERPSAHDGYRVLVDRLWPRGVSQAMGQVDLWLRGYRRFWQQRICESGTATRSIAGRSSRPATGRS